MMGAFMSPQAPPPRVEGPAVRAVRAGDEISVEVEGGFVRRRAPADGIVVQLADRDVFVSADALIEALRNLGRIPSTGR
jgi:hypothetical protein